MASIYDSYISNRTIEISPTAWKSMNERYGKDFLHDELVRVILQGAIEVPLKKISYDDAMASFQKLIDNEDDLMKDGPIYSRAECTYPLQNMYVRQNLAGMDASNYFHQNIRYSACSDMNPQNADEVWSDEKHLRRCLNALWSLKKDRVNASTLRACLQMKFRVVSQFRPSVAKYIFHAIKV